MNQPTASLPIAILAGGQGRRMGGDKAALILQGESLLERTVRTALLTGHRVAVIGRDKPADFPKSAGLRRVDGVDEVRFVPDERRGAGPLGGLLAALRRAPAVALLACDMPLLDVMALRWLLAEAEGRDLEHGLVVRRGPSTTVDIEPLFSVYTGACVELALAHLASGRRALRQLIEAGRFARVEAPPWVAQRLRNVNTPQDLQEVERLLPDSPGR